MVYQVKPHQGRSAETRHLLGWHRLALHLGVRLKTLHVHV